MKIAKYLPCADLADYALPAARAALDTGDAFTLALVGPAGTGKTEAAFWLADSLKLALHIVDCAVVREPRDFLGRRDILADGSTGWTDSGFTKAVEAGGCVVLLDELNRATPATANALLPLLDRRGSVEVMERGKPVIAGARIVWLATLNYGGEYSGTMRVDRALADRFPRTVRLDYMDANKEAAILRERTGCDLETAKAIAKWAAATRIESAEVSPVGMRQMIAAAAAIAAGIPAAAAVRAAIMWCHDAEERQRLAGLAAGVGLANEGGR